MTTKKRMKMKDKATYFNICYSRYKEKLIDMEIEEKTPMNEEDFAECLTELMLDYADKICDYDKRITEKRRTQNNDRI